MDDVVMADSQHISEEELLSLSQEVLRRHRDHYWTFGLALGYSFKELNEQLSECKDDRVRSLMKVLTEWWEKTGPAARSQLRDIVRKKRLTDAMDTLEDAKYPYLADATAPSDTSSSIGKSSIAQKLLSSDNGDDISIMVTSVTSGASRQSSESFPFISKESKFEKDSMLPSSDGGSRKVAASTSSSTGMTADMDRLNVMQPPGGASGGATAAAAWVQEHQNGYANDDEMRALPGGDRYSGVTQSTETLVLRDYQVELAQPALQGHNTIVVAPTGSGKTFVAVAVAQDVLDKWDRRRKVIFVVNQVPLVDQQSTVFKKYIQRVDKVCGDHGQSGQRPRLPLNILLRDNDVVVLTAQILVDALQSKQVSLKDIGLIIFDECHETKKGNQYNIIMELYYKYKLDGDEHAEPRLLPQILGMTASLGVGGARDVESAKKYMIRICANLDVMKIVTVQKHTKSLAEVENKPTEDTHTVPDRVDDAFQKAIHDIMIKIFSWMSKNSETSLVEESEKSLTSYNHSSERFGHALGKLGKSIGDMARAPGRQRSLITCCEHLQRYSSCLAIHETVRSKDALKHLQTFMEEQRQEAATNTDTDRMLLKMFQEKEPELKELSRRPDSENPGLLKLQELLEEACHTSTGVRNNFRGILFTQTIASTHALKAWVFETETLKHLNPELLVGCRNPGMSQRHQTQVLDRFRDGHHHLLIATSVLQQGIDVPACNCVARYDYTSDAVGRMQTRGRTRAPEGRFELVVHECRGLHQKDSMGKEQEAWMIKATEELGKLEIEEMQRLVSAESNLHRNQQAGTRNQINAVKPYDTSGTYSFYCWKCDTPVCRSSDIWKIAEGGHHVVFDREILNRMTIRSSKPDILVQDDDEEMEVVKEDEEARGWKGINKSGDEIKCIDCVRKWGSVLNCSHGVLLALSSRNLRVRYSSKSRSYAKWGNLPFRLREEKAVKCCFSPDEISQMSFN